MLEAIDKAGYVPGTEIALALDCAASELHTGDTYTFRKSGGGTRDAQGMIELYSQWVDKYPIVSIEDGLAENDWDGWKKFTDQVGDKVQLVGDDLFVTNVKFLKKGPSSGEMKVTVYTPKRAITVDGPVTFNGPASMSTCP